MEKNIVIFVAKCPNYQQVKIENQRQGGLLQNIPIPTRKWEEVNIDLLWFCLILEGNMILLGSVLIGLQNQPTSFPSLFPLKRKLC